MSRAARFGRRLAVGLALSLGGCGPRPGGPGGASLDELRARGRGGASDETLARWLLGELVSPGGDAQAAREARRELDAAGADHFLAHLARCVDDRVHGRLPAVTEHCLAAVEGAREQDAPEARLAAWFAAIQSAQHSRGVGAWPALAPRVQALIETPGGIGWRARSALVEWWLAEAGRAGGGAPGEDVRALGCVTALRFAGPFGSPAPVHLHRRWPPEAPGPWPGRWAPGAGSAVQAATFAGVERGCEVAVEAPPAGGVYYAETFLELSEPVDVLLAAQGALALWVDDRQVLDRDPRTWGVWPRFGVSVRLAAGRHRVLARLAEPRTLLRALRPDGSPLGVVASADPGPPYALVAPEVLADPNDLMAFVGPRGVIGEPDDLTRFIASELAHREGEDDVAVVLLAPLVEPVEHAAGPALASAAEWLGGDPALGRAEATDQSRAGYEAAVAKDPELWRAQLGLALAKANAGDLAAAVEPLRALSRRHPDVPAIWNALGIVLGRLGWEPERRAVVLEMAERFDDAAALETAAGLYELRGELERGDRAAAEALRQNPDSELLLARALRRRDYPEALREITRLEARQPFRARELERRRREVRLAAGDPSVLSELLAAAVEASPQSGEAWLAQADALRAAGDAQALSRALGEATLAGADPAPIVHAIDVASASSDFEPYRIDGKAVTRAYERAGRFPDASAARVLDYAAVWVHADGSSRMLEHEIVRVQSAEAIGKFAEHRRLEGLVLNMRVIKRDGRTLEPELVTGKPTVTFPHLEIGDYIETEHVQGFPALEQGRAYAGLRWFFREEDVAYARSELVIIAPADRELDLEVTGQVPEPEVVKEGAVVTRRWRVDDSPAAPVEPLGAPLAEFLPSVRVGWGNGLERRLRLLSEQVADPAPVDPRVAKLAREVVGPASLGPLSRARKAYRWVQENIEDGQEGDGRRALTSRSGNRWSALRLLLRAEDIPVSYVVAKNRLAAPALGPMSDAEAYSVPLLRVGSGDAAVWLTLQEQFAPFGYVPVEARGMPAYELAIDGQRQLTVPLAGDQDRLEYEGRARLGAGGSARLSLRQRFVGKYAMRLRAGLTQVPAARLHELVEQRLLGQALPGAELIEHSFEGRDDLDAPLLLNMEVALGRFAEGGAGRAVLEPPLMPRLTRLATLPERQTPLLIRESMHQSARLEIELPEGTEVWGQQRGEVKEGEHRVVVRDELDGRVLVLDREVSIAAGRVSPESYSRFLAFTQSAEQLLSQPIVLTRPAAAPASEP